MEFDVVFPQELVGTAAQLYRCRGRVLRKDRLRSQHFGQAISVLFHRPIDAGTNNQRAFPRYMPNSPMVAMYTGLRSVVRDLSLGGAFIEDPEPLLEGRTFKIQMQSHSLPSTIVVEAVVRRVERHEGMAVEFVALTMNANRGLQELLGNVAEPHDVRHGGPMSKTG